MRQRYQNVLKLWGSIVAVAATTVVLFHLLAMPNTPSLTQPLPTATPNVTIATPILVSSPVVTPDLRIAEWESKYGWDFMNKLCAAPCRNVVRNRIDRKWIRLDDFIVKFGPPDKIIGAVVGAHLPDVGAELYYINRGVVIRAIRPIDPRNEVTPNMIVGQFDFLQSRTRAELLKEIETFYGKFVVLEFEKAEEWKGFGPMKMLNR
jgi:hypothetical protein